MLTQPERESRPAGDTTEPAQSISTAIKTQDESTAPTDILADLDALAESLRGYLVLQVEIDDEGHRRTQVYRSAAAVERAVKRANERGRRALVTLATLTPLGIVSSLGQKPTAPRPLAACVWCGSPTSSTDTEPMHSICAAAHAVRGGAA